MDKISGLERLARGVVHAVIVVYKKQPGSCRHPRTSRIVRDSTYVPSARVLRTLIYRVCSVWCGHCGTKARQYVYVQRKIGGGN
jgi:hypothetical protein